MYAIHKYKLHMPTPDEVMTKILYSTRSYWFDKEAESKILKLLNNFTGVELAAVMYVNDLFHLKKYNEDYVKDSLSDMSKRVKLTRSKNFGVKNIGGVSCDYVAFKNKKKEVHIWITKGEYR